VKKTLSLIVAFLLITALLSACGGGASEETAASQETAEPEVTAVPDIDIADFVGHYVCTGIVFAGIEMRGDGIWITFEADGTGVFDDSIGEYPIEWSSEYGLEYGFSFTSPESDLVYNGTYENGVIKMSAPSLGGEYTMERETTGDTAPEGEGEDEDEGAEAAADGESKPADDEEPEDKAAGEEPAETVITSNMPQWWDGQWYGWYTVHEAGGVWKEQEGEVYVCLAYIDMREDLTGTLYLWD
jgi:hypothetical protein